MNKIPYIAVGWFIGAAIFGSIDLHIIKGLAFLLFGVGMIFLFNHFKNDLLQTAESMVIHYIELMSEAEREGRERADAELLARSEEEVRRRTSSSKRRTK